MFVEAVTVLADTEVKGPLHEALLSDEREREHDSVHEASRMKT
jgi:hypothetical protein